MNIIERIGKSKKALYACHPPKEGMRATAYLGRSEMDDLMAYLKVTDTALDKNIVGGRLILNLNLVEVSEEKYLRVA